MRTHNLGDIDVNDLAATREAVARASEVGHWRGMLAIFGDHLAACRVRAGVAGCDCGFRNAFMLQPTKNDWAAVLDEPSAVAR